METSEKLHGSALFFSQLKATLIKNVLLKKREKRKTIAEVFLPLYSLGILILIKLFIPNPNFPAMQTSSQQHASLFKDFRLWMNHSIAFAPNNSQVRHFLHRVDALWADYQAQHQDHQPPNAGDARKNFTWLGFASTEAMLRAYWQNPAQFAIAVLFDDDADPIGAPLKYELRTNPMFVETPPTATLYSSPANCRFTTSLLLNQQISELFPLELGDTCPVNQYYYSGFVALQSLLDYAKISVDTSRPHIAMPSIQLQMFPKEAYTSRWIVAFRMIIPFYMVMSVSQFITYLLMLVVGEKESRIREGMHVMGLRASVFWLAWLIVYAAFVLWLSVTCCLLIYVLNVFRHTNMLLIFVLTFLYALTVIMFGFMLTPFFDKARTAGILGNFAVNIMSVFYFLQIFLDDGGGGGSSAAFWIISLLSSSGYALAMDKALVMDLRGEGISFANMWSVGSGGMPFAGSIVMMAVDVLLYGALAYYFDCVIPAEHGVQRSPVFCLRPSFWCGGSPSTKSRAGGGGSGTPHKGSLREDTQLINGSSMMSVNGGGEDSDVEQVAREMRGREAIVIAGLCKSFNKGKQTAVNGIDLTIYEGHITAVLGHNGAGKTTLFNMLTGLTKPTAGTAYIFGYDIRNPNEMDQVRAITGVCPQHDILFDCLTAREHLQFFAAVKGIPPKLRDQEVLKTLTDVDLFASADVPSRYLSGGQKRKLSVGIAVIGDPKIIILDEPTAGVDPQSRRHMWSVLQSRRRGKVILLTTHFMDEADILADRKAVVSKGRVRCCGSSLFLKNKFGIGYHLTLVLEGSAREHAIARLVVSHVPRAERARRHGRELSFILPHNAVDHFPALFAAIEQEVSARTHRLGISSFGVSMTTLEEVFLHLERDAGEEASDELDDCPAADNGVENLSKKMVRTRALSRSLSLQSRASANYGDDVDDDNNSTTPLTPSADCTNAGLDSILEDKTPPPPPFNDSFVNVTCAPRRFDIFVALLKVRWLRLIRDIQKLYLMVILPLALAALSLHGNSMQTSSQPKQTSIALDPALYANQSTLVVCNETRAHLDDFLDQFDILGASRVRMYDGNYSTLLQLQPNMGAINVRAFSATSMAFTLVYNDTFTHSLPLLVNLMNNAVYRWLSEERLTRGTWSPIESSVRQLPQTRQPEGFNLGVVCTALFVGMIFVLVPGNLAIDMVYDRQIRAKNQLRVNGLGFGVYFASYFSVLASVVLLIMAALLGIVMLFDIPALRNPSALIVLAGLVLLYAPASILYNACLSYMFDKMDSAQALLPHICTSVGSVPFFLVVFLDMLRVGGSAPFVLHVVFSVFNPMYVPYAIIYYVQRVYLMCTISSACAEPSLHDYMTDEIVVMLAATCVNIPILGIALLLIDSLCSSGNFEEAVKSLRSRLWSKEQRTGDDVLLDVDSHEDVDVQSERQKVEELAQHQQHPPVVMVQNLHKVYNGRTCLSMTCACCSSASAPPKTAVKALSLAVDAGEVFGLLGHNGAGKTTTMKIITGEETATRGRVHIGGHSIVGDRAEAFKMMGYCPQHDALWKNITVREHLDCYATIRGVPRRLRASVVDSYLAGLQIGEHADKHASQCSGGTRRKLSFALASIGSPKVVLMDEPSTGMDPRSKRFLWDTILASFQGSRGAILTTHSMEEADALCSRVGIMVQGVLRCLGSTQHLKNLYGAGYTLEIKHGGGDPHAEALQNFAERLFDDAKLVERFGDRFVFSVPQRSVSSLANCFAQLEKAKQELDIVEYSFSQTTLEQVFLKFLSEEQASSDAEHSNDDV